MLKILQYKGFFSKLNCLQPCRNQPHLNWCNSPSNMFKIWSICDPDSVPRQFCMQGFKFGLLVVENLCSCICFTNMLNLWKMRINNNECTLCRYRYPILTPERFVRPWHLLATRISVAGSSFIFLSLPYPFSVIVISWKRSPQPCKA
jgi:hypothetical protein